MVNKNKISRLIVTIVLVAVLVCSGAAVTVGLLVEREQRLDAVWQAALAELEANEGQYNEQTIVLSDTNRQRAEELASRLNATLRITASGQFATLTLPEGQTIADVYSERGNRELLEEMSPDYKAQLYDDEALSFPNFDVNETYYDLQRYLGYINIGDVWQTTMGAYDDGTKVKVAVIDSGIDASHPEFFDGDETIISAKSYNATTDKVVEMYDNDWSIVADEHGHGTAVAGVIASQMNGAGIVGIAPQVELLVIKCAVSSDGSLRSISDVMFGIYYAIEQDVDVINMSLGTTQNELESAIKLAYDSDIITVASAGNEGVSIPTYPAAYSETVGVGALEADSWQLASYSNFGVNSDIVAPGTVLTAAVGGGYNYQTGTSFSCPIVAAAAALYVSQNKYVHPETFKQDLLASGKDLGAAGKDNLYGFGCLDVNALILEEKGVITYDYGTQEIADTTQVFVRGHNIQIVPEPERDNVVFDDWYFDKAYTNVFQYENYFTTEFVEDVTLFAKWANEDDEGASVYNYRTLDDGTIEIVSYKGKRRYLTIPDTIDGKTVSRIGDAAFRRNTRLRGVTLPQYLVSIGDGAFGGLENLRQVTFTGNMLTDIGDEAFMGDAMLRSVALPDSLQVLGSFAFQNCTSLATVEIGVDSNLTYISGLAFSNTDLSTFFVPKNSNFDGSVLAYCKKMRSVTVHEQNENYIVENGTVYSADKTTLVYYPAALKGDYVVAGTVKKIGSSAFAGSAISSVDLASAKTIGGFAFDCSAISSVNLASVETIGSNAFSSTNLSEVYIPDTVTRMYGSAFMGSKVTTVRLSENLTELASSAFADTPLTSVTIPAKVRLIDEGAFRSCQYLAQVSFAEGSQLASINKAVFEGSGLTEIALPQTVGSIGDNAFARTKLTEIAIPGGVSSLGVSVFESCLQLVNAQFAEDCALTYLPSNAFFKCVNLVSATLSDNMETIGESAFENCFALTQLNFGQNDKLTTVGKNAFKNCRSLETMQLPQTVTAIGEFAYVFSGLKQADITKDVADIGSGAFGGCYNLETFVVSAENTNYKAVGNALFNYDVTTVYCVPSSVTGEYTLPSTVKVTAPYSFYYDRFLRFVNLPDVLEDIQQDTFYNCSSLEEMSIPSSVFNIGREAFNSCYSLHSVTFGENSKLQRLGIYTFYNCGLREITIPASVEGIAQYAFGNNYTLRKITFAAGSKLQYASAYMFDGCHSLTSVVFEEGSALTSIQAHAFDGAHNLQSVSFGDAKVTNVDNYAFFNCNSLASIELPATVTYIGRYAFYGCSALTSVDIPANVDYIGENAFNGTDNMRLFFQAELLPSYVQNGWDNGVLGYYLSAKEYVITENWEYVINNSDQIAVARYIGSEAAVTLDEMDGMPVVKIGAGTFENNDVVTDLTLSEGLTEIGNRAFYGVSNLAYLAVPASVTKIGEYAFANSSVQVSLAQSGSLEKIGDYAFYGNVTASLVLPDGVTEIGNNAFGNSALQQLSVSSASSLATIGERAFYGSKLGAMYIPASATAIGNEAFRDVTSLEAVTFAGGENSLRIGHSAFSNTGLEQVTLPARVNYVGEYAFAGNAKLLNIFVEEGNATYTSVDGMLCDIYGTTLVQFPSGRSGQVVVPSQISVLTYASFRDSAKITDVSFAEGSILKTIGWQTFSGCTALKTITVPDSVVSFDFYAFENCQNLETVALGEGSALKGVYAGAFYNCQKLQNISLPSTVEEIGEYAFYNCVSLTVFPVSENADVKGIFDYAFSGASGITSIPYLPCLEEIGEYAFAFTGVTQYTLPQGLGKIAPTAFAGSELTAIYCEEGNKMYVSYNGVLFEYGATNGTDFDMLAIWPAAKRFEIPSGATEITREYVETFRPVFDFVDQLVLPQTIQKIGDFAFYNIKLRTVVISENVTDIGAGAFYNCTELENVYFNAVNCNDLQANSRAFANYGAGKNTVTIGKDVTKIPAYLFQGARTIKNIVFEEDSQCAAVGDGAFYNCAQTEQFVLPESVTSIGASAFAYMSALQSVTIPANVTHIGGEAFAYCHALEEIFYNAVNCQTAGGRVFADFVDDVRTKLTIGKDVVSIPDGIFSSASGIRELEFQEGSACVSVGEEAFKDNALESATIPAVAAKAIKGDSLTSVKVISGEVIEDGAFSQCVSLEEITLPSSLKVIGDSAFYYCTNLRKINIPVSVEKISHYAFIYCYNLTELTYDAANCLEVGGSAFAQMGRDGDGVKVVVGKNVENVPANLFYESTPAFLPNIVSVVFEEGGNCQSVGANAFNGCAYLAEVVLSDAISVIGKNAFANCPLLTEINLPANLKAIPEGFAKGSGLTQITIGENVESIGASAFADCASLSVVNFNAASCADMDYVSPFVNAGATDGMTVVVGKNVTKIPAFLFGSFSSAANAAKVAEVTFQEGGVCKSVGAYAFANCAVTSVSLPQGLLRVEEGAFKASALTQAPIPQSVEFIGNNAFNGTDISEVTISAAVKTLGEGAFANCAKLASVYYNLPEATDGVSVQAAFGAMGTEVVATAYIGKDVKQIPTNLFDGASGLNNVNYGESAVTSIGGYAFRGCVALEKITVPETVSAIGELAFMGCVNLAEINYNAVSCADMALQTVVFANCGTETSGMVVNIGNKVERIPDGMFSAYTGNQYKDYHHKLSAVNFADGALTEIGNYAFAESKYLSEIVVPQGVTSVGAFAFYGCDGLESAVIADSVTAIADNLFDGCGSLESLAYGNVQSIGSYALRGTNLQQITVPASVTEIGVGAFGECGNLTDVFFNAASCADIPSFTSSPLFANSGADEGVTLTIGKDVQKIPAYLCYSNNLYPNKLADVAFADGCVCTEIGDYAFSGCNLLKEVELGGSVEIIGEQAFADCTSLETLTLSENLTQIGRLAFAYVNDVTTLNLNCQLSYLPVGLGGNAVVNIGGNVAEIADSMFREHTEIAQINFAENSACQTIGNYAFYGCTGLSALEIPESVTSIGNYAFANCFGVTELRYNAANCANLAQNNFAFDGIGAQNDVAVIFGKNVTKIPAYLFHSVSYNGETYFVSIADVQWLGTNAVNVGAYAFYGCAAVESVNAANVGDYSFYNCVGLAQAEVGGNVGNYAFYGCESLEQANVNGSVGNFAFGNCTALSAVTIGEAVTSLGDGAFGGCESVAEIFFNATNCADFNSSAKPFENVGSDGVVVTIGKNVTKIPAYLLGSQNANVTELNFAKDGVCQTVGTAAFAGCVGLAELSLPQSLTTVGNQAFAGTGIESLNLGGSLAVGSFAFGNCAELKTLVAAGSVTAASDAFENCPIETAQIPANLASSVNNANLKTVVISGGDAIAASAFLNCTELESVEMSYGLQTIGANAFKGCVSLKQVTIPASVTNIGGGAFYNCTALEQIEFNALSCTVANSAEKPFCNAGAESGNLTVVVGKAVEAIPAELFYQATVTQLEIAADCALKTIGANAFYGCENLEKITIPKNVTEIGGGAFYGCKNVAELEFYATNCADFDSSPFALLGAESGAKLIVGADVEKIPANMFHSDEACNVTEVEMNEKLKTIGDYAFYGCGMSSLEIPETVESIGVGAFCNCAELTAAELPEKLTVVADYLFYGCAALEQATIPAGVTAIGNYAFYGCTEIAEITIPAGVTSIGMKAFENCVNVEDIYYGATTCNNFTIDGSAFVNVGSEDGAKVFVSKNVTMLPSYLFNGATVNEVEFEKGTLCTSVGTSAFGGCKIESATIPAEAAAAVNNNSTLEVVNIIGGYVIASGAFNGNKVLAEVHLPDTLTTIGDNAFYGCIELTSVTIPVGVTSIGASAFYNCKNLEEIHFNAAECADLASASSTFYSAGTEGGGITVTIGKEVKQIPAYLFGSAQNAKNYVYPNITTVEWAEDGVCATVGAFAFYKCTHVETITVPASVTAMGNLAFGNMTALTEIKYFATNCTAPTSDSKFFTSAGTGDDGIKLIIGKNVESLPQDLFGNVAKIVEIEFEDGSVLQSVGASAMPAKVVSVKAPAVLFTVAFSSGTLETAIVNGGEALPDNAFKSCTKLESVELPDGLLSIGISAFQGCKVLSSINIPASVTSIGAGAFQNCKELSSLTLPDNITEIGASTFQGCSELNVNIPASATTIGDKAFYGCTSLTAITIPVGVTSIGTAAFQNCTALDSITYNARLCADLTAGNSVFYSAGTEGNGITVTFGKEVTAIPAYLFSPVKKEAATTPNITTVEWEEGSVCETIGISAFNLCAAITSLTIPAGIKTIGANAFAGTKALTEIKYFATNCADGTTSSKYFTNAGADEDGIKLVVGANVQRLPSYMFNSASKIVEVEFEAGSALQSVGTNVFAASGVVSAKAPAVLFAVQIGKTTLETATVMSGEALPDGAFNDFTALESVELPNGLTSIGNNAFKGCSKLENIDIPATVTSIGNSAFSGCTILESVTLPNGLVSLGDSAFANDAALTEITLPQGLTTIGTSAFSGCTALERAEIPSGVTTIGASAFSGCTALESAEIPNSVTTIGVSAFSGCLALLSLYIGSGVTSIGKSAFSGCRGLTEIYFGAEQCGDFASSQNYVFSYAGVNGDGIRLTIGNKVKAIPAYMCYPYNASYAPKLTSIYFEAGSVCQSIGTSAFNGCASLVSVHIGANVTQIGNNTFNACNAIANVYVDSAAVAKNLNTNLYGKLFANVNSFRINAEITEISEYLQESCLAVDEETYEESDYVVYVQHTHSWSDWTLTIPATCTEEGEETRTCSSDPDHVHSETRAVAATGHTLVHHAAQDPTCTEEGWAEYDACTECDYTTYQAIAALGHDYHSVVTEPTCTEQGYTTHTCSRCGDSYVDNYAEALGHDYHGVVTQPTCTEQGYTTYTCSRCGDSYVSDYVEALGHDLTHHEGNAPTCTESGWKEYDTCSRCDYTTYEALEPLGHAWGEWTTIKQAGCTTQCEEMRVCAHDETHTETRSTEALGHDYHGVVTEPTCTEQGYTTYTCSRCGDSYVSDYTEALGHDLVHHAAQDPTCTEVGWKEYDACSRCDYTTYEEIAALGHDYHGVVTEPTCTEQGYTTYTCARCGDSYVSDYVEALGHDLVHHDGKAPTCTEAGWTEYDTCSRCDYTTYEALEPLGHDYHGVVTEPTCTEQGYTTYTCARCGDSYVSDYVEALGHDLSYHEGKAPTCTEAGWKEYEDCSRCDHTTYEEIAALGHDYYEIVVEPTCTEQGYTVHACTRCGDRYVDSYTDPIGHAWGEWTTVKQADCTTQGEEKRVCAHDPSHTETRVTEALGHDYHGVVTEPTCTEQGYTTFTCTRCGHIYFGDYTEPLGHDLVHHEAKAPTCHEEGWTEYDACSRCDYTTFQSLPQLSHKYSEEIKQATCTEDGYVKLVCDLCGDSYIDRYLPATGHDYHGVVTSPTCTEQGYTTYTCSYCGDSYVTDYVEALGHSESDWEVTKEPTCTEDGSRHTHCYICGEELKVEVLPAHGHEPTEAIVSDEVAPTCTEHGSYEETVYCGVCGEVLSHETKTTEALGHDWNDWTIVEDATTTHSGTKERVCARCGERETMEYSLTAEEVLDVYVSAIADSATLSEKAAAINRAIAVYVAMSDEQKQASSATLAELRAAMEQYNRTVSEVNQTASNATDNAASVLTAATGALTLASAALFVLKRRLFK